MNRCTFGLHKWIEKTTYINHPIKHLSGVLRFLGDVCDICGKHRIEQKNTYEMKKITYRDKRKDKHD